MARLDSVLKNFANHVTSGLSDFILVACEACEACEDEESAHLTLVLLPKSDLPDRYTKGPLPAAVLVLREKFLEILAKETAMAPEQIGSLVVKLDFAPDADRVEARRKELAAIPVDYAQDPIYRGAVLLELTTGEGRTVHFGES